MLWLRSWPATNRFIGDLAHIGTTSTEQTSGRFHTLRLPANQTPTLPADVADRLQKFKKTLGDEVNEIDDIVALAKEGPTPLDVAVAIADLLGGVIVYCRSEALKYGLPLEEVTDIIIDSNESKLGDDVNPIYDANGKFLKGPNYWKPEPKIRELLDRLMQKI